MEPIVLNLNAQCRVKLTPCGRRVFVTHFVDRGLEQWIPNPIPKDFTLWELMQIFGPHVYHGVDEVPFVGNRIEVLNPGV